MQVKTIFLLTILVTRKNEVIALFCRLLGLFTFWNYTPSREKPKTKTVKIDSNTASKRKKIRTLCRKFQGISRSELPAAFWRKTKKIELPAVRVTQQEIWLLWISQPKKDTLTGGNAFFVSMPFCETKSTDLKVKSLLSGTCFFWELISFGEANPTDARTEGRTHFWKNNFCTPPSANEIHQKRG